MEPTPEQKLAEIEALRKRLNEMAQTHSFTNPKVLEISRKLDELVNAYNRLGERGNE